MIGVYNYTVILTYMSFLSALTGIYFSINGNSFIGIICLMFSGLCDMFDGKVARTKKNRTEIEKGFGIELDSLSDLVAFGVLPASIGVSLGVDKTPLVFTLFLLPLGALIRLAFFNVDEQIRSSKTTSQRHTYLGLPVTTTAIILPLVYALKKYFPTNFTYIYGITLLIVSILFVTKFEIKKPSTKGLILISLIGLLIFISLLLIYLR